MASVYFHVLLLWAQTLFISMRASTQSSSEQKAPQETKKEKKIN
jgi:hypothetical protein